jgi:hypothetical protein
MKLHIHFREPLADGRITISLLENVRPHPGPLPQEREKRSALSGSAGPVWCSLRLVSLINKAAIATREQRFHKGRSSVTLSSGERAGVRASVPQTNSFRFDARMVGRRMGRTRLQFVKNCVPDALTFPLQFAVPESQFFNALSLKKGGSLPVMGLLGWKPMAGAVQFDGEMGLHAEEVERVFSNRMASAKFVAVETAVAQPAPHKLFGPGRRCAGSGGFFHRN